MGKIYMVEGYDGSGKTSVSKIIANAIGAKYVHFFSEYDVNYSIEPLSVTDDELVDMTKKALDKALADEQDIVLDRGLITPISALPEERWDEFKEYFDKIPVVLCYANLEDTIYRLKIREEDESNWYNNEYWIDINLQIAKKFNIPIVNTSKSGSVENSVKYVMEYFGLSSKLTENKKEIIDTNIKEPVDCVLIYPYLEDANWKNELRSKDNLALGYLTSCARQAGYTVKILHAEHNKYTPTDIQNLIQKYSPKAIGISLTAQRAYPVVKEYVQKIKEVSSSPIYLGGIFPSIAYELILKECNGIDAICLGEGEVFIVDYLNAIIKGEGNYRDISGIAYKDEYSNVCVNGEKNVIENLDEIPLPAKDFFDDMKKEISSGFYYAHISAGRGCYGNCSFCSMSCLTDKNNRRVRSPKNVVDEIKYLQEKYGINCFYFVDELFIDKTNLQWIYDFCDEMKKQKIKILLHAEARVDSISEPVIKALKEVGLDNLFIGFESGNIATLRKYRKGHKPQEAEEALKILRDLDVTAEYGYIMIDPELTYEQLTENVQWILKIGGYTKHNLYNKLNLYYGTDLYKAIKEESPDGLPFYERKITKFKDKRVETFSMLIDIAKELFADYNERVNDFILAKVKEYSNNQVWQDVAEEINDVEIVVWEEIILSALKISSEPENIGIDEWNKYIDNHKRNLSLNLNCIIAKTQEKHNLNIGSSEVESKRRFKPL